MMHSRGAAEQETKDLAQRGAAPYLRCADGCGYQQSLGPAFYGCPRCASQGRVAALEVAYDDEALAEILDNDFWLQPAESLWHYAPLLPLSDSQNIVSLGAGHTPLLPSRQIGTRLGLRRLLFKNETSNPTWSHKDRIQSVSISLAVELGYRRLVTISTGNFGASAAAHAAAAGMSSLILCPEDVSPLLLRLIQSYGADVIVSPWGASEVFLPLVVERGDWYPATAAGFAPPANPFGVEGAKTIAYELVQQCGGRPPDAVLVPCAAGDTLAGISKGFADMRRLGRIDRLPRLYGCQPVGANALEQTLRGGLDAVVTLDNPFSVATSTREPTTGNHALRAIRASGGGAPIATDDQILAAVADLGREGFCVEPSSALPVACLDSLLQSGDIGSDDVVVCLLTSSGIKWPETLASGRHAGTGRDKMVRISASIEALEDALAALSSV